MLRRKTRSVTSVVMAICIFVWDPLVRADDCWKSEIKPAQSTSCSCLQDQCTSGSALNLDSYSYCHTTIQGEIGADACNEEDQVVGSEIDCSMQIEPGVQVGFTACIAAAYIGYAVCCAATSGWGILACSLFVLTPALTACGASYAAPCWLHQCYETVGTERDVTRSVSVSLDGDGDCPASGG